MSAAARGDNVEGGQFENGCRWVNTRDVDVRQKPGAGLSERVEVSAWRQGWGASGSVQVGDVAPKTARCGLETWGWGFRESR